MTDAPYPAWLTPGSEVVIPSGRNNTPSPVLTVDRVLKRDIVLSNGDRFSLTRMHRDHVWKPGTGTWNLGQMLYPADSETITRAREAAATQRVYNNCRQSVETLATLIRRSDWEKARLAFDKLGALLEEAPHD